eukprot:CAMPEP_0173342034 /NCGR_PEP_ID=MMETSP1144-20121109/9950_1 /TAXON_ID=483371 /ORGANISM="non described non described, Strain CCMP2298" /LENGTH=44 /DNA_ID= /DNA_START= /DNA_END= /DNA_ORIENTATION=
MLRSRRPPSTGAEAGAEAEADLDLGASSAFTRVRIITPSSCTSC